MSKVDKRGSSCPPIRPPRCIGRGASASAAHFVSYGSYTPLPTFYPSAHPRSGYTLTDSPSSREFEKKQSPMIRHVPRIDVISVKGDQDGSEIGSEYDNLHDEEQSAMTLREVQLQKRVTLLWDVNKVLISRVAALEKLLSDKQNHVENGNGKFVKQKRSRDQSCFYCEKVGHFAQECRVKIRDVRNGIIRKNIYEDHVSSQKVSEHRPASASPCVNGNNPTHIMSPQKDSPEAVLAQVEKEMVCLLKREKAALSEQNRDLRLQNHQLEQLRQRKSKTPRPDQNRISSSIVPRIMVMSLKPPALQPYEGTSKEDFMAFVRVFMDRLSAMPKEERDKLNDVSTFLTFLKDDTRDKAEEVMKEIGAGITLDQLIQKLSERLDSPLRRERARQLLMNCKQKPDEPVEKFYNRVNSLVNQAYGDTNEVVRAHQMKEAFDLGIDQELKKAIFYRNAKNMGDALQIAKEAEGFFGKGYPAEFLNDVSQGPTKEVFGRDPSINKVSSTGFSSETVVSAKPKRKGECRYCKRRGHYAYECNAKASNEAVRDGQGQNQSGKGFQLIGPIQVPIKANGFSSAGLIDTGAEITVAGNGLRKTLGIILQKPKTNNVQGCSYNKVKIIGSAQVQFEIGSTRILHEVHFAESLCTPLTPGAYKFIIGTDLLAKLPEHSIDFKSRKFHIGGDILPIGISIPGARQSSQLGTEETGPQQ